MECDIENLKDYISNLTNHPEIAEIMLDRILKADINSEDDVDRIANEVLSECHGETDKALLESMSRKMGGHTASEMYDALNKVGYGRIWAKDVHVVKSQKA